MEADGSPAEVDIGGCALVAHEVVYRLWIWPGINIKWSSCFASAHVYLMPYFVSQSCCLEVIDRVTFCVLQAVISDIPYCYCVGCETAMNSSGIVWANKNQDFWFSFTDCL